MTDSIWVFGYGSLMNPRSLALTLPGPRETIPAVLLEYRRVCNVPVNGYAYMNLEASRGSAVAGVLVQVWREELPALLKREQGYELVSIANQMADRATDEVFTFIAHSNCTEDLTVPRSYIQTCFANMDPGARDAALRNMRIPGGVYEDLDSPVYQNYAPD